MVFIKNLIMKKYILNTQIAKFEIQSEPHGEWDIWINKMPTLTFESPEAAALAVFEKRSGYFLWDSQQGSPRISRDLSDWDEILI